VRPKRIPGRLAPLLAGAFLVALAAAVEAGDAAPPKEGASLSEFAEGTPLAGWGVGEARPIEVPGDPGDVRFEWPEESFAREVPSDSVIQTRVLLTGVGVFGVPRQGHVGKDPTGSNPLPSYRQGWASSEGGAFQIGFDANMVGFYLDLGFQVFPSRGVIQYSSTWWCRFTDIRVTTICPGFKIQFPSWLKYLYAGDADWEMTWYDYMLNSFPFIKFGVGPVLVERMELRTPAHPEGVDYWGRGLSYTFFLTFGMEWRPFGQAVSLTLEAGIQAFVFTTETAYTSSPDNFVTTPFKIGLSINF
jgi:hypothetical protein